jgi:N-sulfoglucosamine sulfohydrolase
MRNPDNLDEIIGFLQDENPIVRYWGANGCLILGSNAIRAKDALINVLDDTSPDVRISAAEALCHLGEQKHAIPVLADALDEENLMVRVHALNSIHTLGEEAAKAAMPKIQDIVENGQGRSYDLRAAQRLVELYGG